MFFRPERGRRGPHILLIRDCDEPIRLDEARLAAWAMALGQNRSGYGPRRRSHRGMLPDVDLSRAEPAPRRPGLIARLFRSLARRIGKAAKPVGAAFREPEKSAVGMEALGEAGRKSYVWPTERESDDAGNPAATAGKKNRDRAA
ncbi:hypothetical protein [Mesorhizobium sp. KR9-304]|uniref:hypothetical protein n=1 Tax=Mesorhizobium sp. KR9-304 TaxID=3156614 RepID=UPI0032B345E9